MTTQTDSNNPAQTFPAYDGEEFSSQEERHDYETEALEKLLNAHGSACDDYAEHDDFGANYEFIIFEDEHETADRIKRYLLEDYEPTSAGIFARTPRNFQQWENIERTAAALASHIVESLKYSGNVEHVRGHSEYYPPTAAGCRLLFCADGEQEAQIEIKGSPLLESLHARGELNGMLSKYNGDYHVYNSARYNEEPRHVSGSAGFESITLICSPGGGWAFFLMDDQLAEMLTAAIIAHCEEIDAN